MAPAAIIDDGAISRAWQRPSQHVRHRLPRAVRAALLGVGAAGEHGHGGMQRRFRRRRRAPAAAATQERSRARLPARRRPPTSRDCWRRPRAADHPVPGQPRRDRPWSRSREFLIAMGYPGKQMRDPRDGKLSQRSFGDSLHWAGTLAWYYESEGMMPMLIGHSQGGMMAIRILYELDGAFHDAIPVWDPLAGAALAAHDDSRSAHRRHASGQGTEVGLCSSHGDGQADAGSSGSMGHDRQVAPDSRHRHRISPDSRFRGIRSREHLATLSPMPPSAPRACATSSCRPAPVTCGLPDTSASRHQCGHARAGSTPDRLSCTRRRPRLPSVDTSNIVHAADIWYSVKKHWCRVRAAAAAQSGASSLMRGKLNLFQATMLRWRELHPYSAVHAVACRRAARRRRDSRPRSARELEARGLTHLALDAARGRYEYGGGAAPVVLAILPGGAIRRASCDAEIARQLNLPFPADGAIDPFRFFAIDAETSFELAVAYDHFIAGGDSIVLLLQAIVGRYVRWRPRFPQPAGARAVPADVPARCCCAMPARCCADCRACRGCAMNCRHSHRPRYLRWPDPTNGFTSFRLEPHEFAAVLRTAKAWNVTLNDLLIAVMLKTLSPLAESGRRRAAASTSLRRRSSISAATWRPTCATGSGSSSVRSG